MLNKLFKKLTAKDAEMPFVLQWGGYYAYKAEDGTYHAWRLLDFNKSVLHYRPYKTHFDHLPTLDELDAEPSFIMHIPQAAGVLFRQKELICLGGAPLTKDTLHGYAVYLEDARGYPQDKIDDFLEKLIGFSKEGPSRIILARDPENPEGVLPKT